MPFLLLSIKTIKNTNHKSVCWEGGFWKAVVISTLGISKVSKSSCDKPIKETLSNKRN
jgi:hypothetical protein